MVMLGVDPGFRFAGFGVAKKEGTRISILDYGFYDVSVGDFLSDNFTFSKIYEIENKKDFLNHFINDIVNLGFVHPSEVEPFSYTHFYLVSNLLIEINRKDFAKTSKDFTKTNIRREDILDLRKAYNELYGVPVVTVEEIKDTEGTKDDLLKSSLPPSAGGYKSKYLEYKKKYLSLK
ncbi:hypothetical protein EBU94_07745 [bacterium]|nr:hypothetical protein [bacterium]